MLSSALDYIDDVHICSHCNQKMSLCHVPPIHVGDGLGWGSEYMFVCLNDECPLFANGWEYIDAQFGHHGSYRFMQLPNSTEDISMMVGSAEAFKGSVVDAEAIKGQNKRLRQEKIMIARLDDCIENKDLEAVLFLLLDDHIAIDERRRACKLLTELNDISCIEQLRNHVYKDTHLEQDINMAISGILAQHFLRECPFCAELIKARAKVCKHCQRNLD